MIVKCMGRTLAVSPGLVLVAGASAGFGSDGLTPGSVIVAR